MRTNCFLRLFIAFLYFSSLSAKDLTEKISHEFSLLGLPPEQWVEEIILPHTQHVHEVAIVGGGMAGMAAAFALWQKGIFDVVILDKEKCEEEGCWSHYARMSHLRSPKDLPALAIGIPHLTYRAWHEANHGKDSWNTMDKIPLPLWMDYLRWYRSFLNFKIHNTCCVNQISPYRNVIKLQIEHESQKKEILARRVILATGRSGWGGAEYPKFIETIPKQAYAHTSECIDFKALQHKTIAIIGAGASAFDAAYEALENGAHKVDLLMRKKSLPSVEKTESIYHPGFLYGFAFLSDQQRAQIMNVVLESGTPPPKETLQRVQTFSNFKIKSNVTIQSAKWIDQKIILETPVEDYSYDYVILATGFSVDAIKQPELREFSDDILLWKDKQGTCKRIEKFPYLGKHFELMSKNQNTEFLSKIYCFNHATMLSQGMLSTDIGGISIAATRLAEGVTASFFQEQFESDFEWLMEYEAD